MNTKKCLSCYNDLDEYQSDFHHYCAKKLFDTIVAPQIEFDVEQIAVKNVLKQIAITGIQPKLSLELVKNPLRFTIFDLSGNYIVKLPSEYYRELPENEDVTMLLAELVGIKTAKHSLIRLPTNELAYITKRFDRDENGKIAVEDFCQLTENITEYKYRGSVEQIAKIIFKFTTNKGLELQKFFELLLFCFLTGNADMHLKNFSLIEDYIFDEYELSPAYDLVNTTLANPKDTEETALTINGKKNKLQRKDFDALATTLKLSEKVRNTMYEKFYAILPTWIVTIEKSFLSKTNKNRYIEILQQKHNKLFN